MKKIIAAALLALAGTAAFADLVVKDGNTTSQTLSDSVIGGKHVPHHMVVDITDTILGTSTNPYYVQFPSAQAVTFSNTTIGLAAGAQTIGSIGNASFGITGFTAGGKTSANSFPVVLASDQAAVPVDTVMKATSTDIGKVVGFSGAIITTTTSSAAITVTTTPTSGALIIGQIVSGTGITAGTTLASGSGTSWTLSAAITGTGATGVALSSNGPQLLVAANTNRRGMILQNQNTAGDCYINGIGTVSTDFHSLKIPAGGYYETSPSHVGTAAVNVLCTVASASMYGREF